VASLPSLAALTNPEGFGVLGEKYFQALAVSNASPKTIDGKRMILKRFVAWCEVRDIHKPSDLTKNTAERYQKHLHHHRKVDNKPLSVGTQRLNITTVKMFYRWLVKAGYLAHSPLEAIELPKLPKQLPKAVLSAEEVEQVIKQADIEVPTGLRDRAMMETLYSTGIRRAELLNLKIHDVDRSRGLVRITQGKGQKDRIIPIGERALQWIGRYLDDARPELVTKVSEEALFLSWHFGKRIAESTLTRRLGEYVKQANINKPGSVHIFRHSTATLMLENGADIRHIQALLGHEDLSTTQIYTQVAITHLQDVHKKTHPTSAKKEK